MTQCALLTSGSLRHRRRASSLRQSLARPITCRLRCSMAPTLRKLTFGPWVSSFTRWLAVTYPSKAKTPTKSSARSRAPSTTSTIMSSGKSARIAKILSRSCSLSTRASASRAKKPLTTAGSSLLAHKIRLRRVMTVKTTRLTTMFWSDSVALKAFLRSRRPL